MGPCGVLHVRTPKVLALLLQRIYVHPMIRDILLQLGGISYCNSESCFIQLRCTLYDLLYEVVRSPMAKYIIILRPYRPNINLHSRNKLKCQHRHRNKEQLLKSPMCRGIKLWDCIPHPIQRLTTKVKFKQQLKIEL